MSTNNRAALDIKRDLQQLKGDDGEYVLSNLASMYGLPKLVEYIDALLRQAEREALENLNKRLALAGDLRTARIIASDMLAALVALQVGPRE